MKDVSERPFVVDYIIVVCNGCLNEHKIEIDPPFRSAEDFIAWEKRKLVPPCACGAETCDLKLHIVDEN